eukprot:TRINITY_DN8673_c0_g2_i2.p1 TRINITY_DN8673_c0_g2~~TRINITY_DN8673_c0_g2_i2.p1  ORF type:complete len:185 (-),score=17.68 TRINITY_DN8673_c0_g2_i2:231-785(-)
MNLQCSTFGCSNAGQLKTVYVSRKQSYTQLCKKQLNGRNLQSRLVPAINRSTKIGCSQNEDDSKQYASRNLMQQYPQIMTIVLVSLGMAAPAVASELHNHGSQHLFDIAQDQPFWSNVLRYMKFFVTVMLGTGTVVARPIQQLLKNPVSAVLFISFVILSLIGLKFTLTAMLGMDEAIDLQPML